MSYTFTWTQGRRLATAVKGSTNVSYTYNESGIRTSKTVDGTKHTYVLNGTSVYSDTWKEGIVTHVVVYVYDENGSPIGMMYRNSTMGEDVFEYYIFAKNLQGDITAVYDEYGGIIVEYTYDAWGNVTETLYDTTSNGQYNSFRYRGYFYDEETGLYYLNSRYYDPATGRFLNADIYVNANGDLTGFNMFAYCSNNPVMFGDSIGYAKNKYTITAMDFSYLGSKGEVHAAVVVYLSSLYNWDAEVVIPGAGRADLVDFANREIYEVKPISWMDCNWKRKKADRQLQRYISAMSSISGRIYAHGKHMGYGAVEHEKYDIKYFFTGDGIVFYTFKKKQKNNPTDHGINPDIVPSSAEEYSTGLTDSMTYALIAVPFIIPGIVGGIANIASCFIHNSAGDEMLVFQ